MELAPEDEERLVRALIERRLAPEIAALPGASSFSRAGRRAIGLERERAGALSASREITRRRCDEALRAASVPALLLKGEAVVALTHGDPSRRPMADIDLLVAPSMRAEASRALDAAGFLRPGADTGLHDVFLDESTAGPGLPRGVAVEVHDDVIERPHPFAVDCEGALSRAGGGLPGVHAPRPADALALTGLAFALHENDGRKSWLVLRDIALLARAAEAAGELPAFAAVAGRGAEAAALAGLLRLAERHAGAPASAAEALAGARAETLRRRCAVALLLGEIRSTLEATEPAPRSLTRRLAAALWQPGAWGTLVALGRRALAPGGGGLRGRASRQVRAWGRLGRP